MCQFEISPMNMSVPPHDFQKTIRFGKLTVLPNNSTKAEMAKQINNYTEQQKRVENQIYSKVYDQWVAKNEII